MPYGVWEGTLTHRNIPDVDKDGEWQQDVSLIQCSAEVRIRLKHEDGKYGPGFPVEIMPLRKMYLLTMMGVDPGNPDGWIESQVWTLVDATPEDWTIVQSRAVLNQDMKPTEPWYTFRRLAWGSMKYQGDGCPAR